MPLKQVPPAGLEPAHTPPEGDALSAELRGPGASGTLRHGNPNSGAGPGTLLPVIVVAGECLVDLLPTGDGLLRPVLGGGPFTVARAVGRLGGDVAFLGTLSTDSYGRRARESLAASGVDDRWAPSTDLPTTLAAVDFDGESAHYLFYTQATSAPALSRDQAVVALAATPTALHVGTLGLVLEPCAEALAALVQAVPPDCLVVVDPNCRPAALTTPGVADRYRQRLAGVLARADVVKVSADDLAWLRPETPAAQVAADLAREHDTLVLLTDGADGVLVRSPDEQVRIPVPRVEVVDSVGAGDSFGGGFLAAWTAGLAGGAAPDLHDLDPAGPLLAAVRYGIAVAGITVTRVGADPPTTVEVAAQAATAGVTTTG